MVSFFLLSLSRFGGLMEMANGKRETMIFIFREAAGERREKEREE